MAKIYIIIKAEENEKVEKTMRELENMLIDYMQNDYNY